MNFTIQLNGRSVGAIAVPPGTTHEDVQAVALLNPALQDRLDGRDVLRVIVVEGERVNLVSVIA